VPMAVAGGDPSSQSVAPTCCDLIQP